MKHFAPKSTTEIYYFLKQKNGILFSQAKTKPQEATENETTEPVENFQFNTPSELEEKDWMLGLFSLEIYISVSILVGKN